MQPTSNKGFSKMEKPFNNWFDVAGNHEKPAKNSKCTFTDKYGNSVSLDDSFEDYKDSNIVY